MNQQQSQTVQVIQKNDGCLGGCGTLFAVALVAGLIITYWYVAIPVAVVAIAGGFYYWRHQKQQLPAPQVGPLDPWLNQIAAQLSTHGYAEQTRNTGQHLEGIPLQGDLVAEGGGLRMFANVFSDEYVASQAASKLRANPSIGRAMTAGQSAVLSHNRMVLVATALTGSVDPSRVESVLELVADVPSPADQPEGGQPRLGASSPPPPVQADVLEQLQKLGDLRDKGIVTAEEFESKKTELLRRL